MADQIGGDYIYYMLSNDAAVTGLVSDSIYNARVVPKDDTNTKTVNFYFAGNYNGSLEWGRLPWSASCRAKTDYEALEIAIAVKEALNRENQVVNDLSHYSICTILAVIPPVDESDYYNVPVEILVKRNQ